VRGYKVECVSDMSSRRRASHATRTPVPGRLTSVLQLGAELGTRQGDIVRVKNLVSRTDLNGQDARVVDTPGENGRVNIKMLRGNKEIVNVKVVNLDSYSTEIVQTTTELQKDARVAHLRRIVECIDIEFSLAKGSVTSTISIKPGCDWVRDIPEDLHEVEQHLKTYALKKLQGKQFIHMLMDETKVHPHEVPGQSGKILLAFEFPMWFRVAASEAEQDKLEQGIREHAQQAYHDTMAPPTQTPLEYKDWMRLGTRHSQ